MGLPNGKLKLVLVNFNMVEAAKSYATRPAGPNYFGQNFKEMAKLRRKTG